MLAMIQITKMGTDITSNLAYESETFSVHPQVLKQVEKVLENGVKEGLAFSDKSMPLNDLDDYDQGNDDE